MALRRRIPPRLALPHQSVTGDPDELPRRGGPVRFHVMHGGCCHEILAPDGCRLEEADHGPVLFVPGVGSRGTTTYLFGPAIYIAARLGFHGLILVGSCDPAWAD